VALGALDGVGARALGVARRLVAIASALASAASTIPRTCSEADWASDSPLRRLAWRCSDSISSASRARWASTAAGS
jgi:hypothetical protein